MDKSDNRFQEIFKQAGGDMNHVEWDDHDDPFTWPQIAVVVALIVSVGGLAWWLS